MITTSSCCWNKTNTLKHLQYYCMPCNITKANGPSGFQTSPRHQIKKSSVFDYLITEFFNNYSNNFLKITLYIKYILLNALKNPHVTTMNILLVDEKCLVWMILFCKGVKIKYIDTQVKIKQVTKSVYSNYFQNQWYWIKRVAYITFFVTYYIK